MGSGGGLAGGRRRVVGGLPTAPPLRAAVDRLAGLRAAATTQDLGDLFDS